MKTKLHYTLFLFSLLLLNNLHAQTTYVPDDVFEQFLITEGYDDVLDDYVLTANIENVTALNISDYSVVDLTGIEDFVALISLYVSGTQIVDLDVSMNTSLVTLQAYSTSSISSVNVTGNTALVNLYLYNTPLTSIDVSTNTALAYLFIGNTLISNLDVSTNFELTGLHIYGTSIASLDVSNNPLLGTFDATDTPNLDCITVADAAAATAGTGIYTSWVKDVDDTYSEDCSNNVSISDFDISMVSVGPNPVQEELHITLNNVAVLNNVKLIDITGKLILTSRSTTISTSHLDSGIYLIKIATDKGSLTKKLVKK